MRPTPRFLPALLALFAAACSGDVPAEDPARSIARDSADVRIVENGVEGLPVVTVAGPPRLEIGSVEGGDDELFRVSTVLRGSDGSWIVANAGTAEIRRFSNTGEFVQSIGGRGDGPGEFAVLSGVVGLTGDSLVGWDFRGRRATVFAPDGSLARTFTPGTVDGQRVASPRVEVAPGVLLAEGNATFDASMENRALGRPEVTHSLVGTDGAVRGTLGTFGGAERWVDFTQDFIAVMEMPFAKDSRTVGLPGAAVVAETERAVFRVYDTEGRLVESWRLDVEPVPVTDDAWDGAVAAILDVLPDPAARTEMSELYASVERPRMRPVWSDLHGGADGTLWIRRADDPAGEPHNDWWRLDATGRALDLVRLPPGFDPMWSDGAEVAGILRDELDVEYLRVYPIGGDG